MFNFVKLLLSYFKEKPSVNTKDTLKVGGVLITAISVPVMVFLSMASNIGANKTAQFEGTVLANYYDSVGVKTWCTGETQIGYKPDGSYDQDYCKALFLKSYNNYNANLYSCYNDTALTNLTVPMHVAFVDVYYNTGKKCNTGMMRNMNAGKPREACDFILRYQKVRVKKGGVKDMRDGIKDGYAECSIRANGCYGVWDRRLKMHKLCLSGIKND